MKSRIDQASHHEYFQTRDQALRDQITQAYQHYESEKKRMEKLEFWSKVAGHQGFPSDCNVYHFHPLVFVGNLMAEFREILSKALLKMVYKNATDTQIDEYHLALNSALYLYKHDNLKSIAYFIGQTSAETEDLKYKEEIANGSAYEGRADLGNRHKGDGVKFKGRGMIQLTGRANYESFERYARKNIQKYRSLDITSNIKNAHQLVENTELNVLASLWYWIESDKGKKIQSKIKNDDIFWISVYVNGWQKQVNPYFPEKKREPNHMKKRIERTNIAKKVLLGE